MCGEGEIYLSTACNSRVSGDEDGSARERDLELGQKVHNNNI